jgi:RNA recognition motif-containing protein
MWQKAKMLKHYSQMASIMCEYSPSHGLAHVNNTMSLYSERIDISIDPFTGRNPSYCFVELKNKEQADRAMLELNGKEMLGRPVKIGPGVTKSSRDRSYVRTNMYARNERKPPPFVFDRWERTDAADHWKGYSDQGRRLYIGGLPRMPDQRTANDEIRNLFQGFTMYASPEIPFF